MNCNIASIERPIRTILGLAIASLAFWGPQTYWALLGLILPVTAMINFCPIYAMLGINTCPKPVKKA